MKNLNLPPLIWDKWQNLLDSFAEMDGVVVAFSGGVDSGLLAAAAHKVNADRMIAVTIHSVVEAQESLEIAKKVAAQVGFPHRIVEHDDLANPMFRSNPVDRCYHCKLSRFSKAKELAKKLGFQWVVEGSNASDVGDYRPGMRAVQELGVRSPLLEVGLTKDEIRLISRELGLSVWDRPSTPCLATRIPYGTEVTLTAVNQIAEAEAYLRSMGFSSLRVRYHGNLARIEVPVNQFGDLINQKSAILEYFKKLGFIYVTLDLTGFRSGSMNEEIKQ